MVNFAVIAVFLMPQRFSYAMAVRHSPQASTDTENLKKFISFRSRLSKKIRPAERMQIEFALAEYYFRVNDVFDARSSFQEFIKNNPVGLSTLLANVYLYKIARMTNTQEKTSEIKKEIFKDQFILLFDKYKTLKYTSLYGNTYEVRYFVDKIEIFLNGDIFEQIGP